MKYLPVLLACFTFHCHWTSAQTDTAQPKPQAPRTIIFNSSDNTPFTNRRQLEEKRKSQQSNTTIAPTERWALKVHLSGPLVGEYSVMGEYAFTQKLTAEVNLGVTTKNLIFNLFENIDAQSPDETSDGGHNKGNLGFAGHFHLKYYPSDLLDGFYIGPWVRYRNYNIGKTYGPLMLENYGSSAEPSLEDYQQDSEQQAAAALESRGVNYVTTFKEKRNLMDFMIGFGWMRRFEDYAFFELSFGLGLRSETRISGEQLVKSYQTGSDIQSVGYFSGKELSATESKPTGAAQIRLGIIIK